MRCRTGIAEANADRRRYGSALGTPIGVCRRVSAVEIRTVGNHGWTQMNADGSEARRGAREGSRSRGFKGSSGEPRHEVCIQRRLQDVGTDFEPISLRFGTLGLGRPTRLPHLRDYPSDCVQDSVDSSQRGYLRSNSPMSLPSSFPGCSAGCSPSCRPRNSIRCCTRCSPGWSDRCRLSSSARRSPRYSPGSSGRCTPDCSENCGRESVVRESTTSVLRTPSLCAICGTRRRICMALGGLGELGG